MKVTIEIPDPLYRKVKAQSALLGRSIPDVTTDLYRQWLGESPPADGSDSPEAWLASWPAAADTAARSAPAGHSARQILAQERGRLERR